MRDVKGETCRRYAKSRVRRFKDGSSQAIADGTIRRELNVLRRHKLLPQRGILECDGCNTAKIPTIEGPLADPR